MKKVFLSLLLFLLPTMVSAANYKITDYYIHADVLNNGDMKIEEILVLDGTFNVYERDFNYEI